MGKRRVIKGGVSDVSVGDEVREIIILLLWWWFCL
jgi:hypothetical protein